MWQGVRGKVERLSVVQPPLVQYRGTWLMRNTHFRRITIDPKPYSYLRAPRGGYFL
jgi:hypothetical protein